MNIIETAKLFKVILQHYPNNFDGSAENARDWQRRLNDLPYEVAVQNLDKHIDISSFPPKVSEVRNGWHRDDGGEGMKQSAAEVFALQDELKKGAVPPPPGTREKLYAAIHAARNRTAE